MHSIIVLLRCSLQEVIPDRAPGCSFVHEFAGPMLGFVRDFRLYVNPELHGQGYGFMAQLFVKAFFFPWRASAHKGQNFALPLGGQAARSLELLPSAKSKSFYLACGFARGHSSPNYVFAPALRVPRVTKEEFNRAVRLPEPNEQKDDGALAVVEGFD